MAEQPPKKIGSLRDRIAAFENKGSVPAPAQPPVPRPKPGNVQWKPRATSPPPAPAAAAATGTTEHSEHPEQRGPGMSAADAKESIARAGGSLRERMAALQGRGAFGAPAPATPPPRPSGDKPRWKPPPVVSPPAVDDDEEPAHAPAAQPTSPPADVTSVSEETESAHAQPAEGEEEEAKEEDPEEEERQRRAAIAARMARLGGARVGMAPPIFGKKPDVPPKKVETPKVTEPKEEAAEAVSPGPAVQSPPASESPEEVRSPDAQGYAGGDPAASSTSLLSADSGASSTPRSPSMPVPAVPRRAAPPRRKGPKSPSPAPAAPPPVLEAEVTSGSPPPAILPEEDQKSQELQHDVQQSMEDAVALGLATQHAPHAEPIAEEHEKPEEKHDEEDAEAAAYASAMKETLEEQEHDEEAHDVPPAVHEEEDEGDVGHHHEISQKAEHVHEEPKEEVAEEEPAGEPAEEEEDDETARRARIAERLRQQGGFNPFTAPPPPVRKPSVVAEPEPEAPAGEKAEEETAPPPPPAPVRQPSVRQDSSESNVLPTSPGVARRTSLRRSSVGSISETPPAVPTSTRPDRRESTTSIRSTESGEAAKHEDGNDTSTNVPVNRQRASMDSERAGMQTLSEEPEDVSGLPAAGIHREAVERDDPGDDSADHGSAEGHERGYGAHPAAAAPVLPRPPVPQPPPLRREGSVKSRSSLESQSPPVSPKGKRVSLPPPPRALPVVPPPAPAQTVASMIPLPPVPLNEHVEDISCEAEPLESPPAPRRASSDSRRLSSGSHASSSPLRHSIQLPPEPPVQEAPPSPPVRRTSLGAPPKRQSVPPPPPPIVVPAVHEEEEHAYGDDEAEHNATDPSEYSEAESHLVEEEDAPPPPPRRTSVQVPQAPPSPVSSTRSGRSGSIVPPIPKTTSRVPPSPISTREKELLSDSDVDPIDPSFYSPQKSTSSVALTAMQTPVAPAVAVPAPPPESVEEPQGSQESEVEQEQTRRRTIAERMAKLGGIKFGAPIPVSRPPPPPPPPVETTPHEEGEEGESVEQEAVPEPPEEEDEAARKQRIAARIAGMGGMRFGMLPTQLAPSPVAPKTPLPTEEEEETPPPPPRRAPSSRAPPPAPPSEDFEHESEGQSTSDGVQVEAEESEIEEVSHADVEDAPPPPVPTREGRRTSSVVPGAPPVPPQGSRPPIPGGRPSLPPTPASARPLLPPTPMQSDYVIVDEPEVAEEAPPPPPPRTTSQKRVVGPRSTLPPPPPAPPAPTMHDSTETTGSHWESSLDFGGETDLSLSGQWSEDSTQYPSTSQPPPAVPPHPRHTSMGAGSLPPTPSSAVPASMSADDLMAQWGKVGVQIHEVATTLFEKSRKSAIGDGSYIGFVNAVLRQVPNAVQPAPPFETFGYLIYEQNGAAVSRRASDVMPGDIMVLNDAKFKGHKGLQTYHQNVGANGLAVAIIADYEMKKAKAKVFQANQHVGQESVESVSYRLDDLKSGNVKVFRVLEA